MTESTCCTLITGASSGIGRAVAVKLSGERNVILHGRDAGRLEETMSLCRGEGKKLVWTSDLAAPEAVEASLAEFLGSTGALVDSFVHSAGQLTLLPFRTLTLAQMAETMNVNFLSAARILSALVKKKTNDKRLRSAVLISSTASRFGAKAFSIYSASKGALDAMMRSLAVELAPDVRINSILPGGMRTRMTEQMYADPEIAGRIQKEYPLGLGTPEDVADLVSFLISDRARWITGQQFIIDGGRTVNITA